MVDGGYSSKLWVCVLLLTCEAVCVMLMLCGARCSDVERKQEVVQLTGSMTTVRGETHENVYIR